MAGNVRGPLLVPPAGRAPLFAEPIPIPAAAGPSNQLAAFLGRPPGQQLW